MFFILTPNRPLMGSKKSSCSKTFSIHGADQMLLHIDNRLNSRETILDWDGNLLVPTYDQQGLEQGGKNSSDFYKIFGREQLSVAQSSELGIKMGNITISAIGQADDTLLVSNDIFALFYLLGLTMIFCQKYLVELSADKTRLQAFTPSKDYELPPCNPISINGKQIPFSSQAEHVGILRSPEGNLPAILSRITGHKKALASVLHVGVAKGHRANPVMSIRVEKLYATPVLLSGVGSLVLLKKEVNLIEKHYCKSLCSLQKLHKNTPRCVTYFLGGSLPGEALIHMRQFSIFGMICRLQMENSNLLRKHAENYFSAAVHFRGSWFHQIRSNCLLYGLPHPSSFLDHPPEKEIFKKLVKKKVISYWEEILRQEAGNLTSLKYFKPHFMSLLSPHPLWETAEHSPYKVAMATVQGQMISGRYKCGALIRHWTPGYNGYCELSPQCKHTIEDIEHILQHCPALDSIRVKLSEFTHHFVASLPQPVAQVLLTFCDPINPKYCDFILDCSANSAVISLVQGYGKRVLYDMFHVTRLWTFYIHRQRLKLLSSCPRSYN